MQILFIVVMHLAIKALRLAGAKIGENDWLPEDLFNLSDLFTSPMGHAIKNIAVIRISIIYCYYYGRITNFKGSCSDPMYFLFRGFY